MATIQLSWKINFFKYIISTLSISMATEIRTFKGSDNHIEYASGNNRTEGLPPEERAYLKQKQEERSRKAKSDQENMTMELLLIK
jgi:hypothetical protein